MRFLLFDSVTRFEPGRRIEGVKCTTLADESLRGHFDRRPLYPGTLVLEAMIQLAAWTAIHRHAFTLSLVLSVLEDAKTPDALEVGRRVDLVGELLGTNPKGSIARAWAEIEGERIASIGRLLYAHVPVPDPEALRQRFLTYGGPAA